MIDEIKTFIVILKFDGEGVKNYPLKINVNNITDAIIMAANYCKLKGWTPYGMEFIKEPIKPLSLN